MRFVYKDRKIRYLMLSVLLFCFYVLIGQKTALDLNYTLAMVFVFALVGSITTQFPNVNVKNVWATVVLPLALLSGTVMFIRGFPNLAQVFKVAILFASSVLYYIVLLTDNIFLVVQDREEVFPLYRAAITWGQILVIVVAIPLFTSLFKFDLLFTQQVFYAFVFSFIFSQYQLWTLHFDKNIKRVRVGEAITFSSFVGFMVSLAVASLSFASFESFLKALFVGAVLMFGLTYVSGHLKNEINKRFIFDFTLIMLLFFLVLMFFRP